MKPHLLPLLVAFAAGIGATLAFQALTQPPLPPRASAGDSQAERPGSTPIGKTPGLPEPTSVPSAGKEKTSAPQETALSDQKRQDQKARQQKQWQDHMRDRIDNENDARLNFLAKELGLTPDQLARIKAALAENLDKQFQSQNGGTMAALTKTFRSEDPLETALTNIMNPSQELAYTQLKGRERTHQVEARTMKRFANLPESLHLSEEQRDRVYDFFALEESEALERQPQADTALNNTIIVGELESFSESLTINVGAAMTSAFVGVSESTSKGNPQDTAARMREATRQRNEAQVEALRPILDDAQLDTYRTHLEQTGGIIHADGMHIKVIETQVITP